MASALLAPLAGVAAFLAQAGPAPVFEADIRPIFERRCVECHGIDKQSSGLRLDGFEELKKGGKNGPAIVPGKSAGSRLVELIEGRGKTRMPPKGDRLKGEEVELIKRWIDAGARSIPSAAAREPEVQLGPLPAGFAPILALAGDQEGTRLAIGVGTAVVVERLEGDQAKVETVLHGHQDLVQSLAFSPGGKLLAASGFREVILWETAGWTRKMTLGPHADRVLALDFGPGGRLLAAGGGHPARTGEVVVWEPATGKRMRVIEEAHSDTVFSLDFSPDGTRLASGAADRMVYLLDIASGTRVGRFEGHTHHVLAVAFGLDGKKLISGGADSRIKTWNVEDGQSIKDWGGHQKAVTALSLSPDGKLAASASGDRTVRIWNAADGGEAGSISDAKDFLHAVAFFAGGKLVAACGREPVVRVYQVEGRKLVAAIQPKLE